MIDSVEFFQLISQIPIMSKFTSFSVERKHRMSRRLRMASHIPQEGETIYRSPKVSLSFRVQFTRHDEHIDVFRHDGCLRRYKRSISRLHRMAMGGPTCVCCTTSASLASIGGPLFQWILWMISMEGMNAIALCIAVVGPQLIVAHDNQSSSGHLSSRH